MIGRTVKIGDEDGDAYDATLVRRDGDGYWADLNGFEVWVSCEEVQRQHGMPTWAKVMWITYFLAVIATITWVLT